MNEFFSQIAILGDSWEVPRDGRTLKDGKVSLDPSWDAVFTPGEKVLMEVSEKKNLSLSYSHKEHALVGKGLGNLLGGEEKGLLCLELTSLSPLCFRLVQKGKELISLPQEVLTDRGIKLNFSPEDFQKLAGEAVSWSSFELSLRASQFATSHGFEKLISLPLVRNMEIYEHQLKTVQTVLRRFRGRALLCDEVGLGKTIEGCLVLLELLARKLVRRVLILTPPSLVEQWQGELSHKFGLSFTPYDSPNFKELGAEAWSSFDRIITSYHTAKRKPHSESIARQSWDMVIIDEAHHLRNRKTQVWKFASSLKKKYILLLTATPLQNNLEELYNLVTLLEPGLLSTSRHFQKQFVDRKDKLKPRNLGQLHSQLSHIMVRNRRSTVALHFTRRYAETHYLTPSFYELGLYHKVSHFVKSRLKADSPYSRIALITLQKTMGSSGLAAASTLERIAESKKIPPEDRQNLLKMAEEAREVSSSSKVKKLLEVLRDFPDKMVIFTQFRSTQDYLHKILLENGISVSLFHGSLSRIQKEESVRSFQKETRILLSSESGSEGRNLQFCHGLCNFDLPWNPMRIEQRIGRLSRIGQSRDVYIFNLVNGGTIEDEVLRLLEAKLNLFELVVGEMDMILGNLEEEREFEEMILDLWVDSEDDDQFRIVMEDLGSRLVSAKEKYITQKKLDDHLFGDHFSPEK